MNAINAYLLILHIFFIFTSFYSIQAQNIFDKNQLLDEQFKESVNKKQLEKLNSLEKQALYLFKAQSSLNKNDYKRSFDWLEKLPRKSFFTPAKYYLKFKSNMYRCQQLLEQESFSYKSFKKCHDDSHEYIKKTTIASLSPLRQDFLKNTELFLFHNYLSYIGDEDYLDLQQDYMLMHLSLSSEQRSIVGRFIDKLPKKKQRKYARQLLSSSQNKAKSPLDINNKASNLSDASLAAFKQLSKANTKTSISRHLKLIHDYPNSLGAQKSFNHILNASRQNAKNTFLSVYYNKQTKIPFQLLYKMGHILWNQKLYSYAQMAFEKALQNNPFNEQAHKAQFYKARIFEDQLQWQKAKQAYLNFAANYPSSDLYKRSIFKLGLIHYILNKENKSRQYLNTFYGLARSANEKGQALYWQLKLAQKFNQNNRVTILKKELKNTAPLSFYAAKENLWPTLSKKTAYNSKFSKESKLYSAFLWTVAGFKNIALFELKKLNISSQNKDFVLYLKLWHANQDHTTPVILAYRAIHSERNRTTIDKSLLNNVFPKQYNEEITSTAKKNELAKELVFAIIKQESAFNPKAKSPAGAYGLMQVMPNTAKKFFNANDSKNTFDASILYQPSTNLNIGQLYLKKLQNDYDNNLVYVTSNYNAGEPPLKTWRSRWDSLNENIFIEMIPYKETRNYVKHVLRNYYFYRFLNDKNIDK